VPASTIPDAYDAILAALTPLLEEADATVHDGPPGEHGYDDYLCVGHDPSSGDESTTTDASWSQLGRQRQSESFRIPCLIVVPRGDGTFSAARQRAYQLLDLVIDALPDVTFTGQVKPLQVVEHALLQERSSATALSAGIRFTIACTDARFVTT
jgi:hypothetical protein